MTAILDEIDEFYSPAPAILDETGPLESPKDAILYEIEQNDRQTTRSTSTRNELTETHTPLGRCNNNCTSAHWAHAS